MNPTTASPWWHPTTLWALLRDTATEWTRDKVPRLGAALSYYTVFSIVPLLVVIIALIGLVFGQEAAQSYIMDQLSALLGESSTATIKDMIERASRPSTGILATLIAFGTLLFGASGLFGELQDSLNTIWGVEPKDRGFWGIIQNRFFSFLAVIGTAFLLLVSLVMSAGLAAFGKWFGGLLPAPELILHVLNFALSLFVITGLFALMFKMLPDAEIAWGDVWVGAALTAFLFTIGKFAIGMYVGKSDIGSAYGAAGSLVILLVWVYYSAQILLFGAEFTQVYADQIGSRIVPSEHAVSVDPTKAAAAGVGANASSTAPSSPEGRRAIASVHIHNESGRRTETHPLHDLGWLGVGLAILTIVGRLRNRTSNTVRSR